ncbi:MAG: hypothetical protein ACLGH0_00635 [Thermoanaerobaculia bacterium]
MSTNPYVGPRAFRFGEELHGRRIDETSLFNLLMADRIVLLYSPSGAGKSSLLQAGLAPRLVKENFRVFPAIRVNAVPPAGAPENVNRYALSVMLSIEQELPEAQRMQVSAFGRMTLADYLRGVQERVGENAPLLALIFDQFEEVLSLDPTDLAAKHAFFKSLGEALRNDEIWAVFAIREEFLGVLEEYAQHLPTRLKSRQRLSLLKRDDAIEAIREPARKAGVEFSAAEKLVLDLSRMRVVRPDGKTEETHGPFVEPVQLQVVCLTLWEKPRKNPQEITEADLEGVAVDTALADYYTQCVTDVVKQGLESERKVREWFSKQLITGRGIRSQVPFEEKESGGLANPAIDKLVGMHLVRRDERGGRVWFELSHDRLVEPIRANNAAWAAHNLTPLQTRAAKWEASGRDAQLLMSGRDLLDAITWAKANPVTPAEEAFLAESRKALPELERTALEWEASGRDEKKVLEGHLLKNAEQYASKVGEEQLSPSARTLLALSREHRRYFRIGCVSILAFVGAVSYGIYVWLRSADEITQKAATTAEAVVKNYAQQSLDDQRFREAVIAQVQIENADDKPSSDTLVRYFARPGDKPELRAALSDLGFTVDVRPSKLSLPTNSVWYGPEVPEKDVKLAAYAVIRAGFALQSVQPIGGDLRGRKKWILVGNNQFVADEPAMTTEGVANATLDQLARPAARDLGKEEGSIESYDPKTHEGSILMGRERVFFRLPDWAAPFERGERVRFQLFQGAKRKYATDVQPAIMPVSNVP